MKATRSRNEKLTVYAIREKVGGQRVSEFDDVVEPEALASDEVRPYPLPGGADFDAMLYLQVGPPRRPPWAAFFNEVEEVEWRGRRTLGALVVVRLRGEENLPYYAVTFGKSHSRLLREDAYVRGFGLRVALNVLCEGREDGDVPLQQLSTRRVTEFVLDTRKQTSRPAPFAAFGMDPLLDLLRGVVGVPVNTGMWGRRIQGADPVTLSPAIDLDGLGWLCRRIRMMYRRDDYKRWFDWVDNIQAVREPRLRGTLEEILTERLRVGSPGDLILTPPEVLEWERVDRFRLVTGGRGSERIERDEPRLQDYLDLLEQTGQRGHLDIPMLERHRVQALDTIGERAYQWSVLRCLEGEVRAGQGDNGTTWFVSNGEFYEVGLSFIRKLHRELAGIPVSRLSLPEYRPGDEEGRYNESAAAASKLLLLDRRLVQMDGKGQVELCDLLAEGAGSFVHVKRHFHSSTLSHLFSQGAVAAELLVENVEFRRKVAARVREVEEERARANGDATCVGRYSEAFADGYSSSGREVVFAIIGQWRGHDLVGKLPFFSKMNLREHAKRIRTAGYKVAYAPIEATPGGGQ